MEDGFFIDRQGFFYLFYATLTYHRPREHFGTKNEIGSDYFSERGRCQIDS